MLAQRRIDPVPSVARHPKRRKRVGLLRRLVRNPMACALLLGAAVTIVLSVYVGAYANATKSGYEKSALSAELKSLEMENVALQVTLEKLRQPGCVDEYAAANGMQQPSKVAYIEPPRRPAVARNVASPD